MILIVTDDAAEAAVNILAAAGLELAEMDTVASVAGLEPEHAVEPAVAAVAASTYDSTSDPAAVSEYVLADEPALSLENSHSVEE